MDLTFKPADRSDVDALLGLRRAFCRHEDLPFDESAARAALDNLLADRSLGRVWLIHLHGAAVGYVVLTFGYSLEFDGRDAFVDELYVEEAHRGRGAGGLALRLAEDSCRTLGVRALHLEVDRENDRARAVYEKAGFEDRNNYLLTKRLPPPTP
jgi:ribosomal protein S18 acetylase RimI-like enzyme